jgi:hypothetical protein
MFARTRETGPFGLPLGLEDSIRARPSDLNAVDWVRENARSKERAACSMHIMNVRGASIGHGGSGRRGESLMGRRGTPQGGHSDLTGGASLSEVGVGQRGSRTRASVILPSPDHIRRGGTTRQSSLQGKPVRANGGLPTAGRLPPQALAGGELRVNTLVRTVGNLRLRGGRHGQLSGPDTPGGVPSPRRRRTHRGAGRRLAQETRTGVQNAHMPAQVAGAMPLAGNGSSSAREASKHAPFAKMVEGKASNLFGPAAGSAQELKIPRHAWGYGNTHRSKGKLSKVGGKRAGGFPPSWGPSIGEPSSR